MLYYLGKGTEFKKENCKEYKTIEGALKAAAKDEELVVWDETGKIIGSLTNNVPEGALETNKDGSVNTYDGEGNKVGTITPEELEAATTVNDDSTEGQQNNAGASTESENGNSGGNTPVQPENGQNGANSEQESEQQTSGDDDDDAAGQQTSGDDDNDAAGQQTSGDDDNDAAGEQVSDSDTIYPEKTTRVIVDCDGALNLRRSASWGNENICGRAVRGQSYYVKAIHTVEGKKMLETIDGIFLSGQPEHVRIIEV